MEQVKEDIRNSLTQERMEGTAVDRLWVYLFLAITAYLGWGLGLRTYDSPWLLLAAFFSGWVLSDFVSGLVHWAGDTWGAVDWPWIGPAMIRPFREHHFEPKSITRHDFYDVNGTNCLISLPLLIASTFVNLKQASSLVLFIVATSWSLTLWTFMTNQIHKWAHQDEPAPFVRWLQSVWVILPPSEHEKHHTSPFWVYYCITSGWLNPILAKTGFYRKAEWVISWLTGAKPRGEERTFYVPAKPQ